MTKPRPTEFTLLRAQNGGWIVYQDETSRGGRPAFAGSLAECTNYIEQTAEPFDISLMLDLLKEPNHEQPPR